MEDFNIHRWRRQNLFEGAKETMSDVTEFSADEMEAFLLDLAKYFKRAAPVLTNMDALSISEHLYSAYTGIKNRTGN